jgi:uncharacterized protein (TIGR03437 family)
MACCVSSGFPVLPVSVTIGGDNAVVSHAGCGPGYPAGLMGANAVIPSNAQWADDI